MDLIARNPYRVLGVFANDTNKVRTANMGKIRAFLKVGKEVHFDIDVPNLLGPINRTQEMLDNAISLLSDETEAALQALFWYHSGYENTRSYANRLNIAINSLANEDYASAADNYFLVINSHFQEIRKAVNFLPPPQGSTSNKQFVQLFIERLTAEYPDVDWWQHFSQSGKRAMPHYLKDIFEKTVINKIKENIDGAKKEKPTEATEWLRIAQKLRRSCIPHIKALQPCAGSAISDVGQMQLNLFDERPNNLQPHGENTVSAEGQLVLDELCKELIRESRLYYTVAKSENEESVLPTLQLVDYALSLASSNDVKEKAAAFKKELDQDVRKLPPKEVKEEAQAIKKEIKAFCWKPDEIQWSIQLVKNCFPYLKAIKEKLGRDNAYYIAISTRIADNAMYNSVNELKRVEQSYKASQHTEHDHLKLVNSLRRAWELLLYFQQMNLSEEFHKGKLRLHVEAVQQKLRQHNVKYSDITISESLLTNEELLIKRGDYASLVPFCKQHPVRPFSFEKDDVLKWLEEDLSKRAEDAFFKSCKSRADYEEYLRKYPNGRYAEDAKNTIEKMSNNGMGFLYVYLVLCLVGIIISVIYVSVTDLDLSSEETKDSTSKEVAEKTIGQDNNIKNEVDESYSLDNTSTPYDSLLEARQKEVEEWGENHLSTGATPYRNHFGNARTGDNYMTFQTKGDCDYIIIVKRASDDRYVNHIYIRGGDKATLYLPDGYYNVYFYSGKGWNPNKKKGSLTGGFVSIESQQKDGPIDLVSAWVEYTLYPVQNGNLKLKQASEEELFGE